MQPAIVTCVPPYRWYIASGCWIRLSLRTAGWGHVDHTREIPGGARVAPIGLSHSCCPWGEDRWPRLIGKRLYDVHGRLQGIMSNPCCRYCLWKARRLIPDTGVSIIFRRWFHARMLDSGCECLVTSPVGYHKHNDGKYDIGNQLAATIHGSIVLLGALE